MARFDIPLEIAARRFQQVVKALRGLASEDMIELHDVIGQEVETQTRERIRSEGPSPDGKPWPAWSAAYRKTRHANHRLLQNEGNLFTAITHFATAEAARIGTAATYAGRDLSYAAAHQKGTRRVPRRSFLGLDNGDAAEIVRLVGKWVDGMMSDRLSEAT
jgi:phage virion morphogenesis protein